MPGRRNQITSFLIRVVGDSMALAIDVIKARLRETFGQDSQETVGKKLNMNFIIANLI